MYHFPPLSEWSVFEVKDWALRTFGSETVAEKFEQEEIDGRILLSTVVRSSEAMEKLGLDTIGKKGKFSEKLSELTWRRTQCRYIYICILIYSCLSL